MSEITKEAKNSVIRILDDHGCMHFSEIVDALKDKFGPAITKKAIWLSCGDGDIEIFDNWNVKIAGRITKEQFIHKSIQLFQEYREYFGLDHSNALNNVQEYEMFLAELICRYKGHIASCGDLIDRKPYCLRCSEILGKE